MVSNCQSHLEVTDLSSIEQNGDESKEFFNYLPDEYVMSMWHVPYLMTVEELAFADEAEAKMYFNKNMGNNGLLTFSL